MLRKPGRLDETGSQPASAVGSTHLKKKRALESSFQFLLNRAIKIYNKNLQIRRNSQGIY
jgi:hypothetical protein